MNRLQANICLICVTLCWSTEVIIFSCIPADVSPFATTSICNTIAALILTVCFFRRIRMVLSCYGRKILLRCLLLGVLNCGYNTLYQYGLNYFDVSSGAFTFSMTAVILPVVLITMRKNVAVKTWVSVALVMTGIVVALGGSMTSISPVGLLLMVVGCVLRAIYIVKLNDFAREYDPVTLSVFVSVFVAVISFVIWLIVQPAIFGAIHWSGTIVASLFIHAYFIIVFAQTLNIFAQKRATATESTIIYTLEIVFSLIWGAVLPETLIERAVPTPFHIIGAVLIVIGSLIEIVELKGKGRLKNGAENR